MQKIIIKYVKTKQLTPLKPGRVEADDDEDEEEEEEEGVKLELEEISEDRCVRLVDENDPLAAAVLGLE